MSYPRPISRIPPEHRDDFIRFRATEVILRGESPTAYDQRISDLIDVVPPTRRSWMFTKLTDDVFGAVPDVLGTDQNCSVPVPRTALLNKDFLAYLAGRRLVGAPSIRVSGDGNREGVVFGVGVGARADDASCFEFAIALAPETGIVYSEVLCRTPLWDVLDEINPTALIYTTYDVGGIQKMAHRGMSKSQTADPESPSFQLLHTTQHPETAPRVPIDAFRSTLGPAMIGSIKRRCALFAEKEKLGWSEDRVARESTRLAFCPGLYHPLATLLFHVCTEHLCWEAVRDFALDGAGRFALGKGDRPSLLGTKWLVKHVRLPYHEEFAQLAHNSSASMCLRVLASLHEKLIADAKGKAWTAGGGGALVEALYCAQLFLDDSAVALLEEGPERRHQPMYETLPRAVSAMRRRKAQGVVARGGAVANEDDVFTVAEAGDVARLTVLLLAAVPALHRRGLCTEDGRAIMPPAVTAELQMVRADV